MDADRYPNEVCPHEEAIGNAHYHYVEGLVKYVPGHPVRNGHSSQTPKCRQCGNPVMARPGQPHECPKWYLAPSERV